MKPSPQSQPATDIEDPSKAHHATGTQSSAVGEVGSTPVGVEYQAVLRKQRADQERRLEALAVEVLTALGERDGAIRDAELRAGGALVAVSPAYTRPREQVVPMSRRKILEKYAEYSASRRIPPKAR